VTDPISLVVHGHFYQPPREDPWTGEVPEQPSAAPHHDWNERITVECYGPVTELGLLDLLSWNVGPTLLSWLELHHADVYQRVVDADRRSQGHRPGLRARHPPAVRRP
jgi:alpha-amylase/alpha-mannosidase (GH57 family)